MAQKKTPLAESTQDQRPFVFGKANYTILLISIAVVVLGFALMVGETDIYEFRKIVLAPIVVLSGFALGFYSILKKPSENK